jgi:hypothetical protein
MGNRSAPDPRPAGHDDDALMAAVAAMLERVDPVPPGVVELAKLSFGLRDLDSELARLVADSSRDPELVGFRAGSTTAPRLLTFEAGDLELEVEVGVDDSARGRDARRLLGMILPAGPARIEIHSVSGSTSVDVDDTGAFTALGLDPGPMRLTCHRPGVPSVSTPWTVLD